MTVTPLSRREFTGPIPRRSRRTVSQRRPLSTGRPAETPNALTVSLEITLTGETRYRDAQHILDGLRRTTQGLVGVTLDVEPSYVLPDDLDLTPGPTLGPTQSPTFGPAPVRLTDDSVRFADFGLGERLSGPAETGYRGSEPGEYRPTSSIGAVSDGPGETPVTAEGETTTGAIRILPDSRRVLLDGEPVELTRIEFDLLAFLAAHPHRVFSRSQLLAQVWGYAHAGERTVDVHIRRVRGKLGDLPIFTTLRSIGYRLTDGVDIAVVRLH